MEPLQKITSLDTYLFDLNLESYLPLFDVTKRKREVIRDVKTYRHERHFDYPYILNVNSIDFFMNIHLIDTTLLERINDMLATIGYETDIQHLQLYKVKSDVGRHIDKHRPIALNHVIKGAQLDVVYNVNGEEYIESVKEKETIIMDTLNMHGVVNVSSEIFLLNCSLVPL
jgi:hypothetical protein